MAQTIPLACSLGAADQQARIERMRALARRALTDRTTIPAGARLSFTVGDGVEAELRDVAAEEAVCCAFLDISVTPAPALGQVHVDVTGPPEAAPVIAGLFPTDQM